MSQEKADRVSIGSWIVTFILFGIPVVNIVYFFCLVFGLGLQPKVSLARATLILSIIGIVFGLIAFFVLVGSVGSITDWLNEIFSTWTDSVQ